MITDNLGHKTIQLIVNIIKKKKINKTLQKMADYRVEFFFFYNTTDCKKNK